MSDPFFNADLFGEIDRLQRQMMANLFTSLPSSLRAARIGAFPPVNIGSTDDSVEIVVFAPGLDSAKIKVLIDKGLLTISGKRRPVDAGTAEDTRVYAQERFAGAFRRVIELPRHADLDKGARPLCEWLPDGQRRPFRGVEAARDCRPVTGDALRHSVNRTNRNRGVHHERPYRTGRTCSGIGHYRHRSAGCTQRTTRGSFASRLLSTYSRTARRSRCMCMRTCLACRARSSTCGCRTAAFTSKAKPSCQCRTGCAYTMHAEIRAPRFARAFTLSPDFDVSRIDAQLRDGVLKLTIPRRDEARPRRIEVNVG
ncbi:MAG: Molecular chaperone (small heat shock protein) [uncultured Caballeronia sp.]|nr:MAG: Molecular chaperone (small heat shock protein) [uncultured Caballeronia sp.]